MFFASSQLLAEMINRVGLFFLAGESLGADVARAPWRAQMQSRRKLSLFALTGSAAACLCSHSRPLSSLLPFLYTLKVNSLKMSLKLKKNFCLFSFYFFCAWPS